MAATIAIGAALAAIAIAIASCGSSSQRVTYGDSADGFRAASSVPPDLLSEPAPRIRLRDAAGGVFDTNRLSGKPYAVTFLYANCPDVCPLIAAELQRALSQLGAQAGRLTVVAVSVDPRGDTPSAVRTFLKLHHEPPNFHYLIGSRTQLEPVWKAYAAAPQIPGDPQSSHTADIWLVDRDGHRRAAISAGAPVSPDDLAYDFRRLLTI